MAKYTLAPSARADLEEIWQYISEYSEESANKFIRELASKFELLATNKQIGRRHGRFYR